MGVQNECRSAWKEGEKAAEAVRIGVKAVASQAEFEDPRRDLKYAVMDGGEPVERTTPELNTTAMNYGLLMNQELLTGLQRSLGDLSPDLLRWLNESTEYTTLVSVTTCIGAPEMTDQCKISAFCIFQSFFMGYYYSIFGRLIDTSTLALQTVEGAWGFRSEDLLRRMRFSFLRTIGKSPERMNTPHFKTFSRRDVFEILAMLFMGSGETILGQDRNNHGGKLSGCMGIVGRRTMLINTMLGKCSSPRETGGFTLLDVDVGGLPRDHNGLIMSGENIPSHGSETLDTSILAGKLRKELRERGTDVDATFGVEADWDGNPDSALVCVRYKGRRITTLSPTRTDWSFCKMVVPPRPGDQPLSSNRSSLEQGLEVDLPIVMRDANLPTSPSWEAPVLVQVLDQPRLRYALAALYHDTLSVCKVATDCVRTAKQSAMDERESVKVKAQTNRPLVIVAGMTDNTGDVLIKTANVPMEMYEITSPKTR
jgi:hypothetical protein